MLRTLVHVQWTHLCRFAINSTLKSKSKVLRYFIDSRINVEKKGELKWKRRRRFDVDNSSIRLSKLTKYGWVLHVDFSMSFWCQIDVTSKLFFWRNAASWFYFLLYYVFSLAIYSKINLKFEVWKMLPSRCNFNVRCMWRSNMNIPFMLKWI